MEGIVESEVELVGSGSRLLVSIKGEVMMDHRLVSDALKRRDEQARQGHIALLILPGLNGRHTVCDINNNNKHPRKNNGRSLIPGAGRIVFNVRGRPRFDNHKEQHSERTIVFDYENVDVH